MVATSVGLAKATAGNAALFERLDADANGLITAGEVASEHGRLIDRMLRRGDADRDKALSRAEFIAALVPSRPEKRLETKGPDSLPEANAVRWLLLTMDSSGNGWIEAAEVPKDLKPVFDALANRLDTNSNKILESFELVRGGRPLAQIAGRYVRQSRIDVDMELKQLEREQGAAAKRFEQRRRPLENLTDPQQARRFFMQLDANKDGQLASHEVPQQLARPIQRLLRTSDRDNDGRLSQREFMAGARRFTAREARQSAAELRASDAMPKESMPAE
jgi:Ca2+-binding EF-hand superfamily protein